MLKANVGLSRKLSKDYNSTGFSLNLEGEINATLDDPEGVIERIRELYDVADEALRRQVEAHEGDSAIAARDVDPQPEPRNARSNGHPNGHQANGSGLGPAPARNGHQNGKSGGAGEPASNKQVAYLQTLAKRQRLSGARLEEFIEETIGRRSTPYDLSKREAGAVIEALNSEAAGDNQSRH